MFRIQQDNFFQTCAESSLHPNLCREFITKDDYYPEKSSEIYLLLFQWTIHQTFKGTVWHFYIEELADLKEKGTIIIEQ